jgi:hypothetical protein
MWLYFDPVAFWIARLWGEREVWKMMSPSRRVSAPAGGAMEQSRARRRSRKRACRGKRRDRMACGDIAIPGTSRRVSIFRQFIVKGDEAPDGVM